MICLLSAAGTGQGQRGGRCVFQFLQPLLSTDRGQALCWACSYRPPGTLSDTQPHREAQDIPRPDISFQTKQALWNGGVWHHPPLPHTGADRPDHTRFLWNSNHFRFRRGRDRGVIPAPSFPPSLTFALRNTLLLCLLVRSPIIPGQASVLCTRYPPCPLIWGAIRFHLCPPPIPDPDLSILELVTLGLSPSTLLCRLDHRYSGALFSGLLCQTVSVWRAPAAHSSVSPGLGTWPGLVNT